MQNISQRYTHWFNKQNDRVGHLFQGRYKAILIQEDGYMKELIRYVHLNPVRAQMVKAVDQYSFSSHRAYAGQVRAMAAMAGVDYCGFLLTDLARYVDRDISALGRQVKTARARVKKYQSLQKKMNMIASQITTKTHA